MKTTTKNRIKGAALLCCAAALMSIPFMQSAMQGSISSGGISRQGNISGGGAKQSAAYNATGAAANFRDMSNNVMASSGFPSPLARFFGAGGNDMSKLNASVLVMDSVASVFGDGGPAAGAPPYYAPPAQPAPAYRYGAPAAYPAVNPDAQPYPYYRDTGRDAFPAYVENAIKAAAQEPVSTFSIDVDSASYGFVRRSLETGQPPQPDSVRIEELVNYFPYNYAVPETREAPFAPTLAVYPCPWQAGHKIVHVGLKGYALEGRPQSNFVFLIDTSGSMDSPDKLPLVISALKLLLNDLGPGDRVSIVTYAGSAGVALPPTSVVDKNRIISVLDQLRGGGSTAGAAGIETAYDLAQQSFISDGNNRVILATDGDFNVGVSSPGGLKDLIAARRDKGIFLSVLGFGMGNYHDNTMQALAQEGNGNAAYISDLSDARKALVEEASSTLFTIAKDVKAQVEFNPNAVRDYRLIGYETRHLNREDFANDKIDAGEIGAGHTVTALYEITPQPNAGDVAEIGYLRLRYKDPESSFSKLIAAPIKTADEKPLAEQPDDLRFAAAVTAFGQRLRHSAYAGDISWQRIIELANGARGEDPFGYRAGFVNLVRLAKAQEGGE